MAPHPTVLDAYISFAPRLVPGLADCDFVNTGISQLGAQLHYAGRHSQQDGYVTANLDLPVSSRRGGRVGKGVENVQNKGGLLVRTTDAGRYDVAAAKSNTGGKQKWSVGDQSPGL